MVAVFVLQALWFATSFHFPMVYDERFHYELINAFTDKWLPYLTNESANIDYYRDLSTRGGLLFHYILSFPLSVMQFFEISITGQVVVLRYINVIVAASGLLVFKKILNHLRLSQAAINVGIMIYVLLPLTAYVAGSINYDNALFLFFALFTLACIKAADTKKELLLEKSLIVIIYGCIASLIKLTFLPVFAAGVAVVGLVWFKRFGGRGVLDAVGHRFRGGAKSVGLVGGVLLFVGIVAVILFSSVYIKNLVLHGSPSPACTKTLPLEDCLRSDLEARNYKAEQTKLDRDAKPLSDYVMFDWVRFMISGYSAIMVNTQEGSTYDVRPMPVIYSATTFGVFIMIGAILLGWRYVPKGVPMTIIGVIVFTTLLSLLWFNIQGYYRYHEMFANQPRYLIYIMPIFLAVGVHVLNKLMKGAILTKIALFFLALVLFTQGGGALSYLVRSDEGWYLNNTTVRSINIKVRDTIEPLIKSYTNGP